MVHSAAIKPEPDAPLDFDHGYVRSKVTVSGLTPTPTQPDPPMSSGDTVPDDLIVDSENAMDITVANPVLDGGGNSHTSSDTCEQTPAVDNAMHALTQDSHRLIKTIQKLSALNINSTLPSLPQFVVVGDQSAGKSSITENICEIKLLRGPGTCTRCPFRITLTAAAPSSGTWSCIVSLHKSYSYSPGADTYRYNNWVENDNVEIFNFKEVLDKAALENVLRRAQLAILSPGKDPLGFASPQFSIENKKGQVEFSPNFIALEIHGKNLPELSFFDLPGVINVHKDADSQHLVDFVTELTKEYLCDENALILLAVAAEQEVNNSTAFKLVGQCQASNRCMGVLTKPDLLPTGQHKSVLEMFRGREFKIGGSWYVTKQLCQKELDSCTEITHDDARQRERDFFAQSPWSTNFSEYSSRFGTINLQRTISKELTNHIKHHLPEISQRVQGRLKEVQEELAGFADKPVNAILTVMTEIQKVTDLITKFIEGGDPKSEFLTAFKNLLRDMRSDFAAAAPQIIFSTPGYVKPAISIDEDDEDDAPTTPMVTPTVKSRKGNSSQHPRTPRAVTETPTRVRKTPQQPKAVFKPSRTIFRLDEVIKALDNGSNSMLPGTVNPKIRDEFIKQSLHGWREIVTRLMARVEVVTCNMLDRATQEQLGSRKQTMLFADTMKMVQKKALSLVTDLRDKINFLVCCEEHRPITYATISAAVEAKREDFRKRRLLERVNEYCETLEAKGAKVPKIADRKAKLEEIGTKLSTDEYNLALDALKAVPVYYDHASGSLLDTVAKILEFGLLDCLKTTLADELRQELRAGDETRCIQLVAEDPKREEKRLELQSEEKNLKTALNELSVL